MAQQPLYEEKKARANRRSDHALDEVRLELEINFQQPPDVAALAASSGLSRNFFAARFRERFGMTVDGYLLHLRMEMAKNLLLSTNRPIKEIAYECSIPDPNYFNKQFRRGPNSGKCDSKSPGVSKGTVNMRTIADKLGVSAQTVSLAVRNAPGVSASMRANFRHRRRVAPSRRNRRPTSRPPHTIP